MTEIKKAEKDVREIIKKAKTEAKKIVKKAREEAREIKKGAHKQVREKKSQKEEIKKEKKDRFLHTRVPEELERKIKKKAEEMRVPVSILIRNTLEDVFK
ncbi:hypothetical protein [Candidatus Oleimmundimicrobium sp.]|uniref:hypothetical protein n=1 Tax=Candidatus Oleimmundimicrobium sp. TaxID=3060597 RepID=UPI00272381D0|nr:hypothetical protein [Candidatus Oleimmundimicrobium sp.]MDO8886861.1 hypothetical protein [Candidatus Oleimmundimicrobium sp.]